jgi:hypothetical protein
MTIIIQLLNIVKIVESTFYSTILYPTTSKTINNQYTIITLYKSD